MGRSAYYREQAIRCARLASFKIDSGMRGRLLNLAAEYAAMAEVLARGEHQSDSQERASA
jgi:hypothetical protein